MQKVPVINIFNNILSQEKNKIKKTCYLLMNTQILSRGIINETNEKKDNILGNKTKKSLIT